VPRQLFCGVPLDTGVGANAGHRSGNAEAVRGKIFFRPHGLGDLYGYVPLRISATSCLLRHYVSGSERKVESGRGSSGCAQAVDRGVVSTAGPTNTPNSLRKI
jgi:hypothetical protein